MTREEFLDKCIVFAVKINKLRKYLREKQHEYNNSDQIQRSGTSIGANYSEACNAESKADMVHKLSIAQKEANETMYWLKDLAAKVGTSYEAINLIIYVLLMPILCIASYVVLMVTKKRSVKQVTQNRV